MQKHKLDGWLIVFIIWIVVSAFGSLRYIAIADKLWKPLMTDYPSLKYAVLTFQLLTGAGIVAWLFTAWLIFQQERDTLRSTQNSLLLAGALFRALGGWTIAIFGGLPTDKLSRMLPVLIFGTFVVLLFTGAWFLYLARSQKVREIYGG